MDYWINFFSSGTGILILIGIILLAISALLRFFQFAQLLTAVFKHREKPMYFGNTGVPFKGWRAVLFFIVFFFFVVGPLVFIGAWLYRSHKRQEEKQLVYNVLQLTEDRRAIEEVERAIPSLLLYQKANEVMLTDSANRGNDYLEEVFSPSLAVRFRLQPQLLDSFSTVYLNTAPSFTIEALADDQYQLKRSFGNDTTKKLILYFQKRMEERKLPSTAIMQSSKVGVWQITDYNISY